MKQTHRSRTSLFALPLLILLSSTIIFGQAVPSELQASYELSLQVVIGSNDTSTRSDLPPNLTSISRQLKSTYSFQNYRLANTFLGRVSNTGTVEYKSVSNIFGEQVEGGDAQTFLEWSLVNFQALPSGFQARAFRFGARVPVITRQAKDTAPTMAYESIGLNMNMIGLPISRPTLLGTISLPKTSGTVFLVATIKPAE
ncbi:MAG TPA: hypothetical protein VJV05_15835 [Pyrinomonadaceae bacterium]|nr:hypothetical protein [Pyrinomonadaceae bacterium]